MSQAVLTLTALAATAWLVAHFAREVQLWRDDRREHVAVIAYLASLHRLRADEARIVEGGQQRALPAAAAQITVGDSA